MKTILGSQKIHYSDLIDSIDMIVVVDDARSYPNTQIPVECSDGGWEDYGGYSKDELLDLDVDELRSITNFHALDLIQEAIIDHETDYRLTSAQKKILEQNYRNYDVIDVTRQDVQRVLNKVKKCNSIIGPLPRPNEPDKDFARAHGYEIYDSEYLDIIKHLNISEFIGMKKAYHRNFFGNRLFEFVHPANNYKLKSGQVITEDIKIYIKIVGDFNDDYILAIISFHDTDDENPRRPFAE